MTEQIESPRSARPYPSQQQDDLLPRQQNAQQKTAATDRISLGETDPAGKTYGPGLTVGSPYELLRNLVIKTFREQGLNLQISTGEQTVDLATMTPDEARSLVAEDGYFGVAKTSRRIVDFAINAFGHDPAKLEQMKDAIDKGFLEAQEAFGGALPEISQQTYDAIMEKLDAFAEQSGSADE